MNIVYAATSTPTFRSLIGLLVFDIINPLILLGAAVAFLAFFWGIARYIWSAGDEKSKEYGKNIMLYGVIGLFVMLSVWGLVQILKNTFFRQAPSPTFLQESEMASLTDRDRV